MFGLGKRKDISKPAKRRKLVPTSPNEPHAFSSTNTNNNGAGICDYSALGHVIASQTPRWHTASCIYVVSLFVIGLLSIISIFHGGRRRSSTARGSIRRKEHKRTLAEHIRDGNGRKQATRRSSRFTDAASASSGKVSMLTDDDELDRLADEHIIDASAASPTSVEPLQVQDTLLFPPEATEAEVARFVRARKGDLTAGADQLRHYLDWHKLHQKAALNGSVSTREAGESLSDYDWRVASRVAQVMEGDAQVGKPAELPCVVFLSDGDTALQSLDGARICQHLPARIDTHLASGQVYAQALAIYLDRRLSRQAEEKFDVFIDTRPGEGWGNISAYNLMPFIRHASKLLNDLHPERLHRAVVYPVPNVCAFIWNRMIRPWMDPITADKIVLIGGSARIRSKLPKAMRKIASEYSLVEIEQRRVALFEIE